MSAQEQHQDFLLQRIEALEIENKRLNRWSTTGTISKLIDQLINRKLTRNNFK